MQRTAGTQELAFSLREIPFSYSGSWLNVSPIVAEQSYEPNLNLVSHQRGMHAVVTLVPCVAGERVETRRGGAGRNASRGSGSKRR